MIPANDDWKDSSDAAPRCAGRWLFFAFGWLNVAAGMIGVVVPGLPTTVFLIMAGLFLGTLVMLNLLGITRFLDLSFTLPLLGWEVPMPLAVGVLPYPLTFLCTDFIGEFYGRRRANFVVWIGLAVNGLVLGTLWLGQALPAADVQPPWQTLTLAEPVVLPNGEQLSGRAELFQFIYACTRGAVVASMLAYMAAQFCDVYLFHFWKRLTKGRHLWLRNNGSTMVSQLVDATAVIGITFGGQYLRGEKTLGELTGLIGDNYLFKVAVALVDTIPFYIGVRVLRRYLRISSRQTDD